MTSTIQTINHAGKALGRIELIERPTIVYGKPSPFLLKGFHGKSQKASFFYAYSSEEKRAEKIEAFTGQLIEIANWKANRREERKAQTATFKEALKVGTILSDSWGYEQTQVEFFQVIAINKNKVTIREIGHLVAKGSEGHDCCNVMPDIGNFTKGPIIKTVASDCIKIDSCVSLTLWSGKPKYKSWYY